MANEIVEQVFSKMCTQTPTQCAQVYKPEMLNAPDKENRDSQKPEKNSLKTKNK